MTDKNFLLLDERFLTFQEIEQYLRYHHHVAVTTSAQTKIEQCRAYLDQKIADTDTPFYGINTGFGFLQNVTIGDDQLEELQNNLLMSHACGMGEEVPDAIVRLMLLLKVKSLSYGNSGVQAATVDRLVQMHNADVLPVIYQQGSLGASGDLAPLSHLSLPLIGKGEVKYKGTRITAEEVLQQLNWEVIHLKSKEGLALINGTQFMSAYGLYCLVQAERLMQWADLIAAVSFDAFDCVTEPLHEKIHNARPHPGQLHTAKTLQQILNGSSIAAQKKQQVQDPYSFRCIPQVHGATKDAVAHVKEIFLREMNSVTDNPNIFPEDDLIVSGGNFHGQPLAMALDYFAIAMSELANISERRTYQLISGQRGLPLFLVKEAGLNSGFMIPQYTAAGIVSENKQLCTPASVDSISSSNNQEDHVSMGANAATKAYRVLKNAEKVLAIELMSAAQALDFRKPARSSERVEEVIAAFRKEVEFVHKDRVLHNDMMKAVDFINRYQIS